MKKLSITLVLFLMFAIANAQDYPNILLIIADDAGIDPISGYTTGNIKPQMPTLDKLQKEGITFDNVWSAPVCSPARATIMTGKYGVNNGLNQVPGILSLNHTTLFHELKKRTNGVYQSCLVGKWHLSKEKDHDAPYQYGIDDYMGIAGAGVPDYYKWQKIENKSIDSCYVYSTTYFTDYAAKWIDKQTQPWIMWLAYTSPHTPFQYPPEGTYTRVNEGTNNFKKYLAMIENLDYEMGRLIDGMAEDVKEKTLIIFIGDNGTPGNVAQVYSKEKCKGTLYQGGIHVPMVVAGKGVTRINQRETALVNACDLYATITHMVDESIEADGGIYNSLSFKHLLNSTPGTNRKYNYMELGSSESSPHESYTIRNSRYKYIEYIDSSKEFYDLENDPFENNNLLLGELSDELVSIKEELAQEAHSIRNGWSCNDGIKNGNETGIDCGGDCPDCTEESDTTITYPIVHTGLRDFFDEEKIIDPTESNNLYWQDAGKLNNLPSYTDNEDGTITDNITGLMWEKDGGEKLSFSDAKNKADTLTLAGYTDWRFPTIKELYSLMQFTGQLKTGEVLQLFIDNNYFVQETGDVDQGERVIDGQTWSSTEYTSTTMRADSTVFGVNFIDGRIKGYPKYKRQEANKLFARMVRGNNQYGKNKLVDNNNGTITDKSTNLMWQKTDDGTGRNWLEAINYCEDLELAGYTDWHLPHAKELHSIVDYTRSPEATNSAAIDPIFDITEINDPDGNSGHYPFYWTTSTHQDGVNLSSAAVYIAFGKAFGKINNELMDVHGAGAQRSDPKVAANNETYPQYFGPQGDLRVVYNHCRCVRYNTEINTSTNKNITIDSSIQMYPNPTNGLLNINSVQNFNIKVLDLTGKVLIHITEESNTNIIDFSSLKSGIYVVQLYNNEESIVRRVIKR
ncbi:DUF1566 domain-containing protein [Prolixibacteraceae bacterium JC049]|nr:DUF1566 domain-containing protein [Prolixibacteraceae bacterium JC049]